MTTTTPRLNRAARRARFSGRVLLVLLIHAFVSACDDAQPSSTTTTSPSTTTTPTTAPARHVVVFTAHDRVYSEPILRAFQEKTGIVVDPVYDAESAKTTALVNRLLVRRDHPECDVLWNNEVVQTEALAQADVLAPYRSPNAARIPEKYRGRFDLWTGFAARLRVFVFNKKRYPLTEPPATLAAFTDPAQRGRGVIALPYYGTTFTHMAVLHQRLGPDRLTAWLERARDNGTAFAPGNGAAVDLVASGEYWFGLTDTDDARVAILEGKPIGIAIPDAAEGAVLIPNTVALIKGAPHAEEAKQLIDFLLSADVERKLAEMPSAQIPLGSDLQDVPTPWATLLKDAPPKELPVEAIAKSRSELIELLRRLELH